MSRLLIFIALLFIVWLAIRWCLRTPPKRVARALRQTGFGILLLGLIFLTATGRLSWLFAIGAALLPLLRRGWILLRYLPLIRGLLGRVQTGRAARSPRSGQTSTVETRFLRMTLDHDSGNMDAEILEGSFADRLLSQLQWDELLNLLAECQAQDTESASLLEAYLDRIRPEWRERADTGPRTEQPTKPASGTMMPSEAREILGVGEDASEQEITQAHRRLMHKLHPDRDGSTYLAAKINQAKDCLLV
jgi:hypothetical protein